MPLVSVIIPTYNRAPFLGKAIDSVLTQTFADFELIVVDDGSTDRTVDLVASYASDKIVYLTQPNQGAAAARNTGIQQARGTLLAFLDSDDYFDSMKLAKQAAAMRDNPDYLVSHTDEIWLRQGRILHQKKKYARTGGMIFNSCLELCTVGMSTVMARSILFQNYGFFDEDLPCCEDYDLWLRVSVDQPFLLVPEPLTVKDGGRDDQLSMIHRTGMDRYRIRALTKLIDSGRLNDEQLLQTRAELVRKCTIYGQGCLKHGRVGEGRLHLELAAKAGTGLKIF